MIEYTMNEILCYNSLLDGENTGYMSYVSTNNKKANNNRGYLKTIMGEMMSLLERSMQVIEKEN